MVLKIGMIGKINIMVLNEGHDLQIVSQNYITFTTAYQMPRLSDNIINKFAKDFPDFTYEWEENRFWGFF